MSDLERPLGGITLDEASRIVDAAIVHGRSAGLPPLSVAVLDTAGQPIAFKREDNSSLLRPEIALAKAYGALAMGMGSRGLAERAQTHPAFIQSIATLAGGRLVPVPGGVLVREASGRLIGAVGVSGALPDQDEQCAVTAVEASDLVAQPGASDH